MCRLFRVDVKLVEPALPLCWEHIECNRASAKTLRSGDTTAKGVRTEPHRKRGRNRGRGADRRTNGETERQIATETQTETETETETETQTQTQTQTLDMARPQHCRKTFLHMLRQAGYVRVLGVTVIVSMFALVLLHTSLQSLLLDTSSKDQGTSLGDMVTRNLHQSKKNREARQRDSIESHPRGGGHHSAMVKQMGDEVRLGVGNPSLDESAQLAGRPGNDISIPASGKSSASTWKGSFHDTEPGYTSAKSTHKISGLTEAGRASHSLTTSRIIQLSSAYRKPLAKVDKESAASAAAAAAARDSAEHVDPLEIQVTQQWEQISAELWSALSRGIVPTLPVPSSPDDYGSMDDDVGIEAAQENSVKEFIDAASGDNPHLVQSIFDDDERCERIWTLLKDQVNKSLNSSILEIGAGEGLSTISAFPDKGRSPDSGIDYSEDKKAGQLLALIEGSNSNNDGVLLEDFDPFDENTVSSTKKQRDRHSQNSDESSPRMHGCVGIKAAQHLERSTVVFMGDPKRPVFGPNYKPSIPLPKSVAGIRDALTKRTINHVSCERSASLTFLDNVLLDIPETFTYQVLSDLSMLPGTALPHEFEVLLGKLLSLSISTFIPTPLPNDRFFSYWRSAADLANAAARAVELDVIISHSGEDENPSNNDWRYNWRHQGDSDSEKVYKEEKVTGLLRVDLGNWGMVEVKTKVEKDTEKGSKDNDPDSRSESVSSSHDSWSSDEANKDNSGKDDKDNNDKKDDEEEFKISFEKKMLPIPSNHSDQGVSISTIVAAGISLADKERIFTMMIREEREKIISYNGASGILFIRGALHYDGSIDAFGYVGSGSTVSGVDSTEHDKRRKARLNVGGNQIKNPTSDAKLHEKKINEEEHVARSSSNYDSSDESLQNGRHKASGEYVEEDNSEYDDTSEGNSGSDDEGSLGKSSNEFQRFAERLSSAEYLKPKIVKKITATAEERAADRQQADTAFRNIEQYRNSKFPQLTRSKKLEVQDAEVAKGIGDDGAAAASHEEASRMNSKSKMSGMTSGRSKSDRSSRVTFEELEKISNDKKGKKSQSKASSKPPLKKSIEHSTGTQKKRDVESEEKSSSRLRGYAEGSDSKDSDLREAQREAEKEALLAVMQKRRSEMESRSELPGKEVSKKKHHDSNSEGIFDIFKQDKKSKPDKTSEHGSKSYNHKSAKTRVGTRRRRLLTRKLTATRPQSHAKHMHKSQIQVRIPRIKKWAKGHIEEQLQMVAHEEAGYRRWWPLFNSDEITHTKDETRSAYAVLVHGRGLGLLSTKIALQNRRSTIVTMKYQADDREAHLALTQLLGIRNNLLCETPISTVTKSELIDANSDNGFAPPFRYSAIGLDVFQRLIQAVGSLTGFEAQLGAILAMSVTSFVELPNWTVLASALDTIQSAGKGANDNMSGKEESPLPSKSFKARYEKLAKERGSDDPWVGLLSAAVQAAQLEGATMRVLSFQVPVDTISLKNIGRLHEKKSASDDQDNSSEDKEDLNVDNEKLPGRFSPLEFDSPTVLEESEINKKKVKLSTMTIVRVDTQDWGKKDASPSTLPALTVNDVGVNLQTLLSLGLIPQQKKNLLRMFLRLPFANIEATEGLSAEVSPHKIVYIGHGGGADRSRAQLVYTPSTSANKDNHFYKGINFDAKTRVKAEARLHEDPRFGALMNEMTAEDTEGGEFSFIEYNSGSGLLSAAVAERYPRATIISVETESLHVAAHLRRLKRLAQSKVDIAGADLERNRKNPGSSSGEKSNLNLQRLADVGANNWVCKTDEKMRDLLTKLYESPEFVRYAVFTGDLVLEHMVSSDGYEHLADPIGKLMSTSMTTFFSLPSARAISLALSTFFHLHVGESSSSMYALSSHPRPRYQNAEMQILSTLGKVPGKTKLSMRLIKGGSSQHMVRVDVVNMTRNVHHHFDYQRDGHQRKYLMHVLRNETLTKLAVKMRNSKHDGKRPLAGDAYRKALTKIVPEGSHPNRGTVTSVYITREHDSWHIPYGTLYGVTLITVLRLGVSREIFHTAALLSICWQKRFLHSISLSI